VQARERHARVAHVAAVVALQQADLEHRRGQRQRGLVRVEVQRGQREQVPQRIHRGGALAALAQPVAEVDLVEGRILPVEARHGDGHAGGLQPLGSAQEGVAREGAHEVQGRGQTAALERGPGAVR
jgi:hypothetical protein